MPKAFRGNLFFFIVIIIMIFGSTLVVTWIKIFNVPQYVAIFLPEILFLLIPSIFYFVVTKRPIKSTLRLNHLGFKSSIIIIGIILFSWPITVIIGLLTQIFFHDNISSALDILNGLNFVSKLAIIALTPAICEEIVLRGVVFGEYSRVNIRRAILANGFLFGIFHLNPYQFFYTFILGMLLAYLVYITNSFFAGVLGHFTFNGIQVVLSEFIVKGNGTESAASSSLSFGNLLYGIILAVTVIIICMYVVERLIKRLKIINGEKVYNFGRGMVMLKDGVQFEEEPNTDRVLNWPFLCSIAVYIIFIILIQMYSLLK